MVNIHLVRPFLSRGLVDFRVALAPARDSTDLGNLYGYDLCRGSTPSPKQLKIKVQYRKPSICGTFETFGDTTTPRMRYNLGKACYTAQRLATGLSLFGQRLLGLLRGYGSIIPTLACILSTDRRCMFMFVDNASAVFENQFGVRACCLYILLVGTCWYPWQILTVLGNYNKRFKYPHEEWVGNDNMHSISLSCLSKKGSNHFFSTALVA